MDIELSDFALGMVTATALSFRSAGLSVADHRRRRFENAPIVLGHDVRTVR